jgi:propanol-preferring alcohol dehydrogenase
MAPETMKAWAVGTPGPVDSNPLRRIERSVPVPGPGQVRVHVRICGVCRTDLHLAEGDLAPRHELMIPGHEVVGLVDDLGAGCTRFQLGDRVGVPWLAHTCGICPFCLAGRENLCLRPRFTGWDIDGGYAEYVVVEEGFAYPVPDIFSDEEAAPLLCAGIIGYRALRRSQLPPAGRLGIYGFGGSAHLAAQIALAEGARVHVMTRGAEARELALELGVASAQGADDPPPEPLDAAILFAPVGTLVPPALEGLDRGGTLAIAGIYLSDIPPLNYEKHLFEE